MCMFRRGIETLFTTRMKDLTEVVIMTREERDELHKAMHEITI